MLLNTIKRLLETLRPRIEAHMRKWVIRTLKSTTQSVLCVLYVVLCVLCVQLGMFLNTIKRLFRDPPPRVEAHMRKWVAASLPQPSGSSRRAPGTEGPPLSPDSRPPGTNPPILALALRGQVRGK